MSKHEKKGLVPERRFPEFKDAGEWKNELFEKIYSFKTTNSLSRDKLNYKQGTVKNIHYGDIHTKFSTLFDIEKENVPYINHSESLEKIKPDSYCVEGDMIFADASEDMDDIGKCIEIVFLNNEKLVSGLHTLLARQIKKKLVTGFGGYLFKSNRIREQIKKESQGTKVLGLSGGRLSSISVVYPADEKEQQKVSDCLASVDELITAQSQKLDALKTHKKGLMQQLFPAEGETVPKRRFPEFRDKGEWEEKFIRDFGEIITGSTPSTTKPEYYGGDRLFVSPADVSNQRFIKKTKTTLTDLGFCETRPVKPESILFVCIGSTIGKVAQNRHECATNQQINAVVPNANYSNAFVYYCLENNSEKISGLAGNHAVPIINKTAFGAVEIRSPKLPEQQRIADCLSSVDELITAQTQKLDALKAHKKGLMQLLFPAMDEVKS
ncbi:MAG: restriction endonuclease subunit S [Geobacter sp.]|nr:restriction endonuclease subunit S [Geobacter sp.]